ncbi:MAG: pitrilysin family protein [bacterium]
MKTTEYTLDNGLRVIHQEKEGSKMVDVKIILGAGNFYNNYYGYKPGVAHFLEHVVHEKTEKYQNKKDLTSILTDYGGVRNAATSSIERMSFYATVLEEFAESACDYISQVVFHSKFDQVAVDKHRKIITEELLASFKKSGTKVSNLFNELALAETDFKFHTLGTEESLKEITLEDLQRFYNERFVAQNCILSISGDITIEKCKELSNKYFINIRESTALNSLTHIENLDTKKIPPITLKKQGYVSVPEKQAVVSFGTITKGRDDPRYFALKILLDFLTNSSNSILNIRLREENSLLYNISSIFYTNQLFGYVYFSLNVQPSNIQQCLDIIKHEIKEVSDGKITDIELSQTKKKSEASEIFYNQSIQDESFAYANLRLLFTNVTNQNEFLQKILAVTKEEVIEAAKWLSQNLNILAVCSNEEQKYDF